MITEADRKILISKDDVQLAEWYCTLNGWAWPEELPDPAPPFYCPGPDDRRRQVMDWIHETVGDRLISRIWNKRMTDEEFEDFWNKGSDPAARARYEKRLREYGILMARLHSPEFDAPLA